MPGLPISQQQGAVEQQSDLFLRVDVGWLRRSTTGAKGLARYEGASMTLRQEAAEATQQVVSRTTGVRSTSRGGGEPRPGERFIDRARRKRALPGESIQLPELCESGLVSTGARLECCDEVCKVSGQRAREVVCGH